MINIHYETDFELENPKQFKNWITQVCESESFELGELNYIFCDDAYLLSINRKYLEHDTYTDIITFDYTDGRTISGDVFISIERVKENSLEFSETIQEELLRVMAHGLLHLMGYQDKSEKHIAEMRAKEEEKIKLFHVEQ
jgi:rRNA maturation RNase YbeY